MPNWTRGRWKANLYDSTDRGDFNHSIKHHEDGCDLTHAGCDSEEDAALIEQAPELYKALDRITDLTVCEPNPVAEHQEKWFRDLRIATANALRILASARGEKWDSRYYPLLPNGEKP